MNLGVDLHHCCSSIPINRFWQDLAKKKFKSVSILCSLIQYCVKAGSYRGPEITPEEEEVEDLIQRFSAVSLLDCGMH